VSVTTIFEKSVEGRRAFVAPELDVPADGALPEKFRRAEPPRLPEISEPEIVRHYTSAWRRCPGMRGCIRCRRRSAPRGRCS
jgi:glycine dehydrogenase subunit 2